jgi:hypothetical protein
VSVGAQPLAKQRILLVRLVLSPRSGHNCSGSVQLLD